MATAQDARELPEAPPVVNYDEPPVKPPPLLAVGPLAWARENLFRTWFDAVLTVIGTLILAGATSSFIGWAISQANWFAITYNLRLLMLGQFEAWAEWRVVVLILLLAFIVGVSIAAWSNLRRGVIILILSAAALMFIVPPAINASIQLPAAIFAAGNETFKSGSQQLTIDPQVAFIARAGETLTIRVAERLAVGDEQLSSMSGFVDRASNWLRSAVLTRLDNLIRQTEIEAQLAGDLLTANQRTRLAAELERLNIPEPISSSYALDKTAVRIRILRPATGALIGEALLENASAPLVVTLPEDGWYVLEKTTGQDTPGVVLLETRGIYPLLARNLNRTDTGSSGEIGNQRISQYARLTDTFTIEQPRPVTEQGENIPMVVVTDHQFRGGRDLVDYLRLFISPTLTQISAGFLATVLALLAGYAASRLLDRLRSPQEKPRQASNGAARRLVSAAPILMFVLIYGFSPQAVILLATLIYAAGWLGLMLYGGMALPTLPGMGAILIGAALTLDLNNRLYDPSGQTTHQALSFGLQLTPDKLLILAIQTIVGAGAVWRGYRRRAGASRPVRGLFISATLIAAAFLGLIILSRTLPDLLPLTDTQRWGGLLLTLMLTVVGIIGSFPIGVLLALGRRSRLPAISGFCTIYIEFVRGVPLITVLFMAQLLVPLVNPSLAATPSVFRAMVGIVLFSAAYLAENVRGGLQSIAHGQEEAARALGLSSLQVMLHITLPQALRAVIPALVGQFISLFKDTSLVAIVGLLDLAGMGDNVVAQTEFLGLRREVYVFLIIAYFIVSYSIATVSRHIETSGAGRAMARQI